MANTGLKGKKEEKMNDILFAFLLVVVCILLAIALNYIFEKLDEKNRINNFLK